MQICFSGQRVPANGGQNFKRRYLKNHWSDFDDYFFVVIHFCSSVAYTGIFVWNASSVKNTLKVNVNVADFDIYKCIREQPDLVDLGPFVVDIV